MPPRCCMLGLKRSCPFPMSQIDLSQFVNKKVKVTTRNGAEHIDYIRQDNGFTFGIHSYYGNGWEKLSTHSTFDIIKIEEVSDMGYEVEQLRDEVVHLKEMVTELKNEVRGLKQTSTVSPEPYDEINLLGYVGKQVVITFRNKRKDYGTILQTTGYYPIKLRGWNTDMTCYNDGRQLLDEECDYDIIHVETLTPLMYDRLYEQMQKLLKELNNIEN